MLTDTTQSCTYVEEQWPALNSHTCNDYLGINDDGPGFKRLDDDETIHVRHSKEASIFERLALAHHIRRNFSSHINIGTPVAVVGA